MAFLPVTVLMANTVGDKKEYVLGVTATATTDSDDGGEVQTPLAWIEETEVNTYAWGSGQTSVSKQGMQVYRNTNDTTENTAGKGGKMHFASALIANGDPIVFRVRGR